MKRTFILILAILTLCTVPCYGDLFIPMHERVYWGVFSVLEPIPILGDYIGGVIDSIGRNYKVSDELYSNWLEKEYTEHMRKYPQDRERYPTVKDWVMNTQSPSFHSDYVRYRISSFINVIIPCILIFTVLFWCFIIHLVRKRIKKKQEKEYEGTQNYVNIYPERQEYESTPNYVNIQSTKVETKSKNNQYFNDED
jgi:hypothetical protein